jgi:cytochrome c biogenesis protein CcdA/thiol-disulfide isomerase/thioredoxin
MIFHRPAEAGRFFVTRQRTDVAVGFPRMPIALILFFAGMLTILLPCILPLIPIVLGVSIAGRSKWRPLLTVLGMLVSFVGFTFLLLVVLRQFVEVADYMRIGTYYILLLFGLGFLTHDKRIQDAGALLGSFFFMDKGWPSVMVVAVLGVIAMHVGGRVATTVQQFGTTIQSKTRSGLGSDNPITAFIMGLTMGLVWVPCAGPALGFAFTLVREEPGFRALFLLTSYGLGTAVPLLLIGYGGQAVVHSVRSISRYSGVIKQISGALLIVTALAFQFHWFTKFDAWLVQYTNFGTLGTQIEEALFSDEVDMIRNMDFQDPFNMPDDSSSSSSMDFPKLPKLSRAPELRDTGAWFNSEPLTMEGLRGKVVLVDFWTYSCINCIRTIPYLQQYWDRYKNKPFVLLGVHTPEFVFEKSEQNVRDAMERLGVTWPVVQDNDFGTWGAFANRYWPAKYLIDADGYVRYTHFGEGAYDETDLAIQSLLNEIGALEEPMETVESGARGGRQNLTPETYLGSRSWPSLGNGSRSPTDDVVTYTVPDALKLHSYYLVGDWQMVEEEKQALRSESGEIRMKFLAGEINLVIGMEEGKPASAVTIEVDGEHIKDFPIDRTDLFELWKGEYGEHEIVIHVEGAGFEGYAFTFGS